MSIRPLQIRMERFRSFVRPSVFTFPDAPGLYFIQGVNEVEERLEANASGKSSLWEALCWLFNDKTSEGLRAGDVCSWGYDKGTRVEFDFVTDNEEVIWTVTRTWAPNTWTLSHQAEFITDEEVVDLAKDPQNAVLAELKLSFDAFLHAVHIAQGRQGKQTFLDMGREQQAKLFSDVMGLEAWVTRAKKAGQMADEQDGKSRGLESDLSRVRGALEALERDDAGDAAARWEDERQRAISGLREDLTAMKSRRRAAIDALEDAEARTDKVRLLLKELSTPSGIAAALAAADDEYVKVRDKARDTAAALRLLDEREEDLLDEKAPCPLCGHHVSPQHRKEHLVEVRQRITVMSGTMRQLEVLEKAARGEVERLKASVEAEAKMLTDARQSVTHAEQDESVARRALLHVDQDMDRVEDRIEEREREVNPHAERDVQRRRERDELLDREADMVRRLDDSVRRASLFAYWSKGFKDIRLQAIAEALTELEVEVNSEAIALGLLDWELMFAVDRETKGGTVQRGFSVMVKAPASGERPVPWEAWSGGEAQRLRLAGQMGLADLIRARTGCAFPVEVWDEPTQGLSERGLQDLFTALADRARREGRIIFLVDHRAHAFGGFAGQATVTKDKHGSRISTSWSKDV